MSFGSDKSDSYFTQGVWCRCFNRAIGLFPAEKTDGTGGAMSFCLFFLPTKCELQRKFFVPPWRGRLRRILHECIVRKQGVDTSLGNTKDRPHPLHSPRVTHYGLHYVEAKNMLEISLDVLHLRYYVKARKKYCGCSTNLLMEKLSSLSRFATLFQMWWHGDEVFLPICIFALSILHFCVFVLLQWE